LGQMTQGEGTIIDGTGSQTGRHLSRWGDYSAMAIDPSDDCTFWYTNEYLSSNGAFNWNTRIASFQLPGCPASAGSDFSISAIPTSLSLVQGASGSSSLSTAVTSGTAGTDSLAVSGVPSGASASLNPGSVTAGNSATLNVNAGSAAAGAYTLTATGTEGSVTHTTTVQLTVTAPSPNFTISEPEQCESGAGHEWLEHHFDDGGRKWRDDQPERVRYSERGERLRHSDVHQCRRQRDAERERRQRGGWHLHADCNGYRGVSDPPDHGAAHRDGAEQVADHYHAQLFPKSLARWSDCDFHGHGDFDFEQHPERGDDHFHVQRNRPGHGDHQCRNRKLRGIELACWLRHRHRLLSG